MNLLVRGRFHALQWALPGGIERDDGTTTGRLKPRVGNGIAQALWFHYLANLWALKTVDGHFQFYPLFQFIEGNTIYQIIFERISGSLFKVYKKQLRNTAEN